MDTIGDTLQTLAEKKLEWCGLPLQKKIGMLEQILWDTHAVAAMQVEAAAVAKGFDSNSAVAGEEYVSGCMVVCRCVRLLLKSLKEIQLFGKPKLRQSQVRTGSNGQVIVNVMPSCVSDRLLMLGMKGEIWMQPHVTKSNIEDTMATCYTKGATNNSRGAVCLILGAGNLASLSILDVIHKMFVEGKVCILKHNPVNAYLKAGWDRALNVLMTHGYFVSVNGGINMGRYLCNSDQVDEIHVTGSESTYNTIVFGDGTDEAQRRKVQNRAVLSKPVTSELGNIGPVIVVPGQWSHRQLVYQARHIATMLCNNVGFNCNAARVLITSSQWKQRDAFLDELRNVLKQVPTRPSYYPRSQEQRAMYMKHNKHNTEQIPSVNTSEHNTFGWTLTTDIDNTKLDDPRWKVEPFWALLMETNFDVPESDPKKFLEVTTEWSNNVLWGTLNATIIIHPSSQRKVGKPHFERILTNLQYGTIGVNLWPALGYIFCTTPWGAYNPPTGHKQNDIQSGSGFVHNTLMFEYPEKTVVYAPFVLWPCPWLVPYADSYATLGRLLTDYEANPTVRALPNLVRWALSSGKVSKL